MRSARRPASVGRCAFTLVELLIVVAVLVIAAAVVIPNIGSAADAQAMSAARVLAADIEMARSLALRSMRPHTVLFSDDLQSYKVVADYDGGSFAAAEAVPHPVTEGKRMETTLAERLGMDRVTVESVSFGGERFVTFNELGEPSASGTVIVAAGDLEVEVAVAALTGTVTVSRVSD